MRYPVAEALTIKTAEGHRTIQPGGILTLPEPQAVRLVAAGKVIPIRQGVTEVHTLDQYPEVFSLALDVVALQDPRGEAIRVIRQDSPETWDQIQAAGDEVNRLWQEAQGGLSVWAEYCAAVENWKNLLLQAIEDEKRLSRLAQDGRSGRGKG
jgi:hypothetical protein